MKIKKIIVIFNLKDINFKKFIFILFKISNFKF